MSGSPCAVRFAVAVQRHPLTSSVAVYACIAVAGLPLRLFPSNHVGWAWATFSIAASTAFAAIGSRMTSAWGRIAVVGVGIGAALPLSWIVFPPSDPGFWFLGISAALVAVPQATVACMDRIAIRAPRAVLAVAAAASPALLWYVTVHAMSRSATGLAGFTAWAVALQIAVHAGVTSERRLLVVVPSACVMALAAALALSAEKPERLHDHLVAQCVAWMCAAPLVAFAAQARAMTAVPDDHPIHADFGGARS
jgi:hypothetical protein